MTELFLKVIISLPKILLQSNCQCSIFISNIVEYAFSSEVQIVFIYYQLVFDHVSLKPSREMLLCQMAEISIHNPK